MLVGGSGVAVGGVLPLARQLRALQQEHLLVSLHDHAVAVEAAWPRVNGAATFRASRPQLRDAFQAHQRGHLTRDALIAEASRWLQEPLAMGTNMLGLELTDVHSNVLVSLGRPLPRGPWPWPER